jgi:hypothetical protein
VTTAAQPAKKLGDFFLRLVEDEKLYKRYKRRPKKVAREWGLSDRHVKLIASGDLRGIQEELQQEYGEQNVICATLVIFFPFFLPVLVI